MNTVPSTNGDNGRGEGGRFSKGNPGGPGNPFARRVARLRSVLLDAVTETDLAEVVAGLLGAAKAGDAAAARLVLSYTVGQPTPAPDPDRLDADETRVFQELAEALGDFRLHAMLAPDVVRLAVDTATGSEPETTEAKG